MEAYVEIDFGKYRGYVINEIPLNYLIWLFPKLRYKNKTQSLYKEILRYFLTKDIRVENHTNKAQGWHFYFNDYTIPKIGGGEKPFIQSFWKMKDSLNNDIYELGYNDYPVFIIAKDERFEITENIKSIRYRFGGLRLVYERNSDYYFYDGFGKVMSGAYLIRKPWIPDGEFLSGDFSKNLLIKE